MLSQVNLAQCAIYLSKAPKSNMVETVYNKVKDSIKNHEGPMPGVPLHLRNASTGLMKQLGYGKGYNPRVRQEYLPECLKGVNFFEGTELEFSWFIFIDIVLSKLFQAISWLLPVLQRPLPNVT